MASFTSFSRDKTFPLNAWYAAACDHEVKRALLPRTVCNKKLVMYRTAAARRWRWRMPAGTGLCRCRRAVSTATRSSAAITAWSTTIGPLHLHAVAGDDQPVGLRAQLPGGRDASPRLALAGRSGAGRSRQGAGPALERRSGLGRRRPTIHVKCDYRLVVDNLMDLTHETFVHGSSIGNRAVAEAPFKVTHSDAPRRPSRAGCATSSRRRSGPRSSASRARSTAGRSSASSRRAPSPSTSASRRPAPARRKATAPQGVNGYVLNTMTPETDTTCHYFWAFVRNYRLTTSA